MSESPGESEEDRVRPHLSDDLAEAAECFLKTIPHRVDDLFKDYDEKLDEVIVDTHALSRNSRTPRCCGNTADAALG